MPTGGNRTKLPSSRWRRRGRSLREIFACSCFFATNDLSQICNREHRGMVHLTPKRQTRICSRFLYTTTGVASVAEKPWDYITYWFTYWIILMDYVQNKKASMINEHKRAISEKKKLTVTIIMKCIADGKFSPTCLDQWLLVDLFMLRYLTIFEFVVCLVRGHQ